jgi:hypothetical protein
MTQIFFVFVVDKNKKMSYKIIVSVLYLMVKQISGRNAHESTNPQ